jgi:hypothetical protein
MPMRWKVLVRGDKFHRKTEGAIRRMGSFVTEIVEAGDESAAITLAVTNVRRRLTRNAEVIVQGMLVAEEVAAILEIGAPDEHVGLAWYDDALDA